MSKLLRFKNLLGMLAIMLTLSMSWSQVSAQNLSSEKEMLTFALAGQTGSSIDQGTRVITVTVPFGTDVSALVATFTSSPFSNVFVGSNPNTGIPATSGTTAADYSSDVTWTVEAENSSYDNYTVDVGFVTASDCSDLLSLQLDYNKDVQGACMTPDPVLLSASNIAFTGSAITFDVEFAADLAGGVTVYYTLCDNSVLTMHPSLK